MPVPVRAAGMTSLGSHFHLFQVLDLKYHTTKINKPLRTVPLRVIVTAALHAIGCIVRGA
jgi:hypothetical protein